MPQPLEYASKDRASSRVSAAPQIIAHVVDAIILAANAFMYWLLGYAFVYGFGLGTGGAFCMWWVGCLFIGLLIGFRGMSGEMPTLLRYVNVVLAAGLLPLTILLILMCGAGLAPFCS